MEKRRLNLFEKLYKELKEKHGKPKGQWKLWCKRKKTEKEREEVIIGAILAQRTNWKNVELAIKRLKKEKINSLKKIVQLKPRKLASLIKPAGFYKVKSRRLFELAKFIIKNYKKTLKMKMVNLEELRKRLLNLKGVGPETCDSILLYALDKPIFVIDEYTRRLVKKKKLVKNFSYDFLQKIFENNLKKDFKLYQDFHALIVIDAKKSLRDNKLDKGRF